LAPEVLKSTFDLDSVTDYDPSYNIAPGETAPVVGVHPEKKERSAPLLRWGLIPTWVDDRNDFDATLINARIETVTEKPSFRHTLKQQRCVVPVNGFYEWKQTDDGKTPYYVQPTNEKIFRLAGLWDTWKDDVSGEALATFTILTTEANGILDDIHHRMPVILDELAGDFWLSPTNDDPENLLERVNEPYPENRIEHYPVSSAVNDPTYDEESCVKRRSEMSKNTRS
jgi:putative SOS response-associated peptidase YedK